MATSTLLPITKIDTEGETLIAIGEVLLNCAVKALAIYYVEMRKIILLVSVHINIWRSTWAYRYGEEHIQVGRKILET